MLWWFLTLYIILSETNCFEDLAYIEQKSCFELLLLLSVLHDRCMKSSSHTGQDLSRVWSSPD